MTDNWSPVNPRVLAQLRAKEAPSAAVRARVRARLAMAVPMGPSGGGGSPNGSAGPGGLRGGGGLGTHVVAIAGLVIGGGAGAATYAALSKPPPPVIVYVDRPVLTAAAASTVPQLTPTVVADEPVPVSPPVVIVPSASTASPASQLAAERSVLDEARAALVQGAPQRALEKLDRHARAFPRPMLGEERDAMRVEALARVGRTGEARSQADAFRRRWPGSLFLPTVDSAVESIP